MGLDERYKVPSIDSHRSTFASYNMSTTPLVSTVPARAPVEAILENLTIPSQDNGVPFELSLLTPYSCVSSSPPTPVLAYATADVEKLETPPPELELVAVTAVLELNPRTSFPTRDEELAPPSDTHLLPPNPQLALLNGDSQITLVNNASQTTLLDDDAPIDYNRVAPTVGEDHDPIDPGIPFFPNTPDKPTYFPLMIGDGHDKTVANYIYYRKNYQEVIGTMGQGQPCYGCSVYLNPGYTGEMPKHITDKMIDMFHPHDPRRIVIDEVLVELRQPRLTAEISRLRDCLEERDAIIARATEIRRIEDLLITDRFHQEMRLSGVRKRLQYARAIPLISEKYVQLTAKPTQPRFERYAMPFVPREGGPCEMPRVHGEKDRYRRKCYECKEKGHLIADCPKLGRSPRLINPCQWCGSKTHHMDVCLIRRLSPMSPAYEEPPTRPRWCGKCFRHDAQHQEIECPQYEGCRNCGERGRFRFLQRHTCPVPDSPVPTNVAPEEDCYYTSD